MKVIFMGTPDFAVNTLEKIIEAGHEVMLVVTQPDKPKGRGNTMQFPPVKECAVSHGLEVFQPVKIREDASVEYLKKFAPDIIIVAAFGQILPKSILDLPKYGCINVHASLLPKYRGAAPIQWAVINGDEITGVTIMRMDVGLDTGDIIAKKQAYTHLDNKAFKIWKARVVETDGAYAPGCICKVGKNTMVVQTGEGGLELLEVQLAGKKRMDAGSFLRGYPVAEGSFLQQ